MSMANLQPFPHRVFDNLWGRELIEECAQEFDQALGWLPARSVDNDGTVLEEKEYIGFERALTFPATTQIHERLKSAGFMRRLFRLTQIANLEFDMFGGGLHRVKPGGILHEHIDFNIDKQGRWRRVNVLLYLNECDPTGDLRLISDDGSITVRIAPKPGRMVVFECSETSWHGHPEPFAGDVRKSIAAYYFTQAPPSDPPPVHHTTMFRRWRPIP